MEMQRGSGRTELDEGVAVSSPLPVAAAVTLNLISGACSMEKAEAPRHCSSRTWEMDTGATGRRTAEPDDRLVFSERGRWMLAQPTAAPLSWTTALLPNSAANYGPSRPPPSLALELAGPPAGRGGTRDLHSKGGG